MFKPSFSRTSHGRGYLDEIGSAKLRMPQRLLTYIMHSRSNDDLKSLTATCQDLFICSKDIRSARREIKNHIGLMIQLNAGSYIMGPEATEPPYLHTTRMLVEFAEDFKMAKVPVTQKQFRSMMGDDAVEKLINQIIKKLHEKFSTTFPERNWIGDELPMLGVAKNDTLPVSESAIEILPSGEKVSVNAKHTIYPGPKSELMLLLKRLVKS